MCASHRDGTARLVPALKALIMTASDVNGGVKASRAKAGGGRLKSFKWATRQSLRRLYYRMPLRWRGMLLRLAFRLRPGWFLHHPSFWRQSKGPESDLSTGMVVMSDQASGPVDSPGRIAVHCHLFYADLLEEFVEKLGNIPYAFDLYVSVSSPSLADLAGKAFRSLSKLQRLEVVEVPNRGRDIAPMLVTFGKALVAYDFIAHIQSKKSLYNGGATQGWREYLLDHLLGSRAQVSRIFGMFMRDPLLGIVYPQSHSSVPYAAFTWLANHAKGAEFCTRLGMAMPQGYFDFPAGSMFWARGSSLRPLFDLGLALEDFPPESAQTDGTTAHALERLLGLIPVHLGYRHGIIKDEQRPSWSTFRLDQQYLGRSSAGFEWLQHDPAIRVVAFDIFDTLLVRPLLVADHTKALTASRLGPEEAELFLRWRGHAEVEARRAAGRDVGMGAIYRQFRHLSGCSELQSERIRAEEEAVEMASVAPRQEVLALLNQLVAAGRRVVLISDMFLERPVIETMLARHGILGWSQLYLSSERGLRKDDGGLYECMLAEEAVSGSQVVIVGDSERSDLQLPVDHFNLKSLHVLKASDLAKALPGWRAWLAQRPVADLGHGEHAIDRELTAGLLVRRQLNKIADFAVADLSLRGADAFGLGFNIIGPLLLSFAAWLQKQATHDGVEDLYFLAREGLLIKQVYDAWGAGQPAVPRSHYLQVSRRAVNVPTLESFDDVLAIAREVFQAGPADVFLHERYGITLSPQRWAEIHRRGIWREGRLLEVQAGDLRGIEPLLREVYPDMQVEAARERAALIHYLGQQGLATGRHVAVVDVGYAGTIQKALNRLQMGAVDGYYLATSAAMRVGLPTSVRARGCFVEDGVPAFPGSRILHDSFELEKLLSADDAQVRRYGFDAEGCLVREFKSLRDEELASRPIRAELQRGCMTCVREAVEIRDRLRPGFVVSRQMADALYTHLTTSPSGQGGLVQTASSGIVLDDDYCGRGLIS